jgi:hypothetical protein
MLIEGHPQQMMMVMCVQFDTKVECFFCIAAWFEENLVLANDYLT